MDPAGHPRSKVMSRELSHSLGGTCVFQTHLEIQLEVCFDKQVSGKRRTFCKLCGRSAAERSDTEMIVSAGIWQRISLGMLLTCWRPAMNNASDPDDGLGSMSITGVGVLGIFRAICRESGWSCKICEELWTLRTRASTLGGSVIC